MRIINHQSSTINKARAFTLLELLVAMVLMVVASACLYTSLYTGFRARRSAAAATEPTIKAINALTLLKQDILGVLQPGEELAGAFVGVDAQGDENESQDSITLYTTAAQAPGDSPVGGLGMIELLLSDDDNEDSEGQMLIRRVTTNLLSPSTLVPEDQVLCRGIRSLNLRYHDGTDWLDAWDSTTDNSGLPVAIEIDLEIDYTTEGARSEQYRRRLIQSFPLPCGGEAPSAQEPGGGMQL